MFSASLELPIAPCFILVQAPDPEGFYRGVFKKGIVEAAKKYTRCDAGEDFKNLWLDL